MDDLKFDYYIEGSAFDDIHIYSYGKASTSPTIVDPTSLNKFPFYSLHFVEEGRGFVYYKNRKFTFSAGDIFILSPEIPLVHMPDNCAPWKIYWINFGGSKAKEFVNSMGLSIDKPFCRCSTKKIPALFRRVVDNKNNAKTISGKLKLMADIYLLFSTIVFENNPKIDEEKSTNNYIEDVFLYINKNLDNPEFSINEVANYMHLNVSYVSRIFKKFTGVCFTHYLSTCRLQKAQKLLTESNYYVYEIAKMVGYNSPLHFSKEFKKYYFYSPTVYQQMHGIHFNTPTQK